MDKIRLAHVYHGISAGILLLICIGTTAASDDAAVNFISPRSGSLGGSTRVTIYGRGFAKDQFNFGVGQQYKGNKVYLTDGATQHECEVHKDGSTETHIEFFSPANLVLWAYYRLIVIVDDTAIPESAICNGNPLDNRCRFRPVWYYTPEIYTISPLSGMPGQLMTVTGRIYTDLYSSDKDKATNGKEVQITRFYVDSAECSMIDDSGTLHGLTLYGEETDEGTISCKIKGTFVGFSLVSFLVSSPYGRSVVKENLRHVSPNRNIYNYQSYTDVTAVSPTEGSIHGCLELKIEGHYFDTGNTYDNATVFVGALACPVIHVEKDSYILCKVPAKPSTSAPFPGNRGVYIEYWISQTFETLDEMYSTSVASNGMFWHDSTKLTEGDYRNYATRITTFLIAPETGTFQFMLRGTNGAQLYMDGTKISTASKGVDWHYSGLTSLVKGQRYLLVIVHNGGANGELEMRLIHFNTAISYKQTGLSVKEVQRIQIESTTTYDVQVLKFSGFSSTGNKKHEVQKVCQTGTGSFRLGKFNVYTVELVMSNPITQDQITKIENALNKLPFLCPGESFEVNADTAGNCFLVTFISKRGDFDLLDKITAPGCEIVVLEVVKGVPDSDEISMVIGSEPVPSQCFSASSVTKDKLVEALNSMFSTRCPDILAGNQNINNDVFEDYESDTKDYSDSGIQTREVMPFCGMFCLKLVRPFQVYPLSDTNNAEYNVKTLQQLCFAYRGLFKSNIWVDYKYKKAGEAIFTHVTNRQLPITLQREGNETSEKWYYKCHNIYDLVITNHAELDNSFFVSKLKLGRDSSLDVYIDAVYIGPTVTMDEQMTTNVDYLIMKPAAPATDALIGETEVAYDESKDEYTVTLKPLYCANGLGLFGLLNGEDDSTAEERTSNSATMKYKGSEQGTLGINRTMTASEPLSGTFDVSWNNNTVQGIKVDGTDTVIQDSLEGLDGIGSLQVARTSSTTCINKYFDVTFTELTGDQQEMTVDCSDVVKPDDVSCSVKPRVHGHLVYYPKGDILRTAHDKPQVLVFINSMPTKCSGSCSFEWLEAATPIIEDINPSSGTAADTDNNVLTITGTGFSSIASDISIKIGDVACEVKGDPTPTQIKCDIGTGRVGAHEIVLHVKGKGLATSTKTFTYTEAITLFEPEMSSLGGGVVLTVTGYGFSSTATVLIGDETCGDVVSTPGKITCLVPPTSSTTTVAVKVKVTGGAENGITSESDFTYNADVTVSGVTVSPTTLTVHEDQQITITGSFPSASNPVLFIGDSEVTIIASQTNVNAIVGVTGVLKPGTAKVLLNIDGNGYALTSNYTIPTVEVDLSLTGLFPDGGSVHGGTKVTLVGTGFGTDKSLVKAMAGDYEIEIDDVTPTQIVGMVKDTSKTHYVTNDAVHPDFGYSYAFDKPTLSVDVGDLVVWSWTTMALIHGINRGIYQTATRSDTEVMEGGFTSGDATPNGEFRWVFNVPGEYHVWSGYVDEHDHINYRMKVIVIAKAAQLAEISVTVADQAALHFTNSGATQPTDSSGCTPLTSTCTSLTPGDATMFSFAFLPCRTPSATSISFTSASSGDGRIITTATEITVTGDRFSTDNCNIYATIDKYPCVIQGTPSVTSFVCKLDPNSNPTLFVNYQLNLRVDNLGYALIDVSSPDGRRMAIAPSVSGVNPSSVSTEGNAKITITGFGFRNPTVSVAGLTTEHTVISDREISCLTPPSTEGTKSILVEINGIAAVCESETACQIEYSSSASPTVTGISPTSISSTDSTEITITGTLFGSLATKVDVKLGGVACSDVAITDGVSIKCNIEGIPAGTHIPSVVISDKGKASVTEGVNIKGIIKVKSVTPKTGSVHGGLDITILGHGYLKDETAVKIGDKPCAIKNDVTISEIVCTTPAQTEGEEIVQVTTNGESDSDALTFNYADASTPSVTSLDTNEGKTGDSIQISGSGFGSEKSDVTVDLDGAKCTVTGLEENVITCTLGHHIPGTVGVIVHVSGLGNSNSNVQFTYKLDISGISPMETDAGGSQYLTVTGGVYDENVVVTVCEATCTVKDFSQTEIVCLTPASPTGGETNCDVKVQYGSTSAMDTFATQLSYKNNLAAQITGISPKRGGTGGGTILTISGNGFAAGSATVTIAGSVCTVTAKDDGEIICTTGSTSAVNLIKSPVVVDIAGRGQAKEATAGVSNFYYANIWSDTATWGGQQPPEAGSFVVIMKGQTILLDQTTPVYKMILIQGGNLIFDEKDIELHSENILITDGGTLQVGTEDEPFQHKATITMHGHMRSPELPIYGNKGIAVREGTLDLHGEPVTPTWTKLAATVTAGATQLTVIDALSGWSPGDSIVVSTTGHHQSQAETEVVQIQTVSEDRKTLTFTPALEYGHLGTQETFQNSAGEDIITEFRAMIGLLTRNVMVRGTSDDQWHDAIEKCESGFQTGEFATQTCFQGRFGEEVGSDQFGSQIIMHAQAKNTGDVIGRISYIEVTHAGQAFRLGRYPIHFHLNGDMDQSYVKGCSIHKTFNRAVNIHGTNNVMVEKNVIYNILGGAMFLEDGVETDNTFKDNLAVLVKGSSSLLNDDITPAAFWITNPQNHVIGNVAAGGENFGYWYRMHTEPDGPSRTMNIAPRAVPLGTFRGNEAFSNGRIGMWVFREYQPQSKQTKPYNPSRDTAVPAVFENLYAWFNEKGFELVVIGCVNVKGFVLVNNIGSNGEIKKIVNVPVGDEICPKMTNITSISKTSVATNSKGSAKLGLTVPFGNGLTIEDTAFWNFNDDSSHCLGHTRITGTCSINCGGYTTRTKGIVFHNSPNKGKYDWIFEGQYDDMDGKLTGTGVRSTVVTDTPSLPTVCTQITGFKEYGARSCPTSVRFIRFAANNAVPSSLASKNMSLINTYGTSTVNVMKKRLTHPKGWMAVLVSGQEYEVKFEEGDQITNITLTLLFGGLTEQTDGVILKFRVEEKPDEIKVSDDLATPKSGTTLTVADNDWMDWVYDEPYVKFLVKTPKTGVVDAKGGIGSMTLSRGDMAFDFKMQKCFFKKCQPPTDPNTVPPPTERPSDALRWHPPDENMKVWSKDGSTVYARDDGNETALLQPQNNDNVVIGKDVWIYVTQTITSSTLKLKRLWIYGTLEFDAQSENDVIELNAESIIIMGGLLMAGWPSTPFNGKLLDIVLTGNLESEPVTGVPGRPIGNKALAVFGAVDLFGRNIGDTWVKLSAMANKGDTTLTVTGDISKWKAGDEIVITSTSYEPAETEMVTIQNISGQVITLPSDQPLLYRHIYSKETINEEVREFPAAVANFARNIRIRSHNRTQTATEALGCRVLVSESQDGDQLLTGRARFRNVDFDHCGQEGFVDPFDPRFALAFVGVSPVSNTRPSEITGCAFRHSYSVAIGAISAPKLPVKGNVIYHTVGNANYFASDGLDIDNNFVARVVWTGTFNDRREEFNFKFESCFDLLDATGYAFKNNYCAASEVGGFHMHGQECDDSTNSVENNFGVGNYYGIVLLATDGNKQTCTKYTKFTIWKSAAYGVYVNSEASIELSDLVLADNTVAVFPMVIGPLATDHICGDKTVKFSSSTVVGRTPSFDCSKDVIPEHPYIKLKEKAKCDAIKGPNGEMLGLVFGQFTQGGNKAPEKPCAGVIAYNSICGFTQVEGVVFANFGEHAGCSQPSFAIATNPSNDDLQHPVETKNIVLQNVREENKILVHRPNLGKINPSDCVDMDCDGLKKVLLQDLDGSLFGGNFAAVISQSEFEWDGDERRGLGDYRIPKAMLTTLDGTRLDATEEFPNKGIIRNGECKLESGPSNSYAFWKCPEQKYEMMALESLDGDTETRRLSPVAIAVDGYIDLINGPQDHGWCDGYTCQERLSEFHALIQAGKHYQIYLSSTAPKKMRFRILNADSSVSIRIAFFHDNPYRIDIYKGNDAAGQQNEYVLPTNARKTEAGDIIFEHNPGTDYIPSMSDTQGSNFVHREAKMVYFILSGETPIMTWQRPMVVVSLGFPTISEEEFYGKNMIAHIAGILGVDTRNIRVVKIVAAGSTRRKRNTGIDVELEVGVPPQETASEQTQAEEEAEEQAAIEAASKMVETCMAGQMSTVVGDTVECETVTVNNVAYTPQVPTRISVEVAPYPRHEGLAFTVQPKIRLYDADGNVVSSLGIAEDPWQMTVSLRSGTGHADATLEGTLTVSAMDGWFTFTDLMLTHAGSGYILDFAVTYPASASALTASSSALEVPVRPLTAGIHSVATDVIQNQAFSVTYDLRDATTDEVLSDIAWRGHSFDIDCDLAIPMTTGNLTGTAVGTYETDTGRIALNGLIISGYGPLAITCHVISTPAEFDFYYSHTIFVLGEMQRDIVKESSDQLRLRFSEDFESLLSDTVKKAQFEMTILQEIAMLFPEIIITAAEVTKGSILVTFTIEGSSIDVQQSARTICDLVADGKSFMFDGKSLQLDRYMTVDGEEYYGVVCKAAKKKGLHPGIIAAIVVCGVLVIAAIIFLVFWKLKIKPKSKTRDTPSPGPSTGAPELTPVNPYPTGFYYIDNGKQVFLGNPEKHMDQLLFNRTGINNIGKSKAPDATRYDVMPIPNMRQSPRPPSGQDLYTDLSMATPVTPSIATPIDPDKPYQYDKNASHPV